MLWFHFFNRLRQFHNLDVKCKHTLPRFSSPWQCYYLIDKERAAIIPQLMKLMYPSFESPEWEGSTPLVLVPWHLTKQGSTQPGEHPNTTGWHYRQNQTNSGQMQTFRSLQRQQSLPSHQTHLIHFKNITGSIERHSSQTLFYKNI